MTRPSPDAATPHGAAPIATTDLGVLVVTAPQAVRGLLLPLGAPEAIIGRGGSVRLGSATVSRHHARVWAVDEDVLIEDLGSANGTMMNGELMTAARPLVHGDRLKFGDVEVVYRGASGRRAGWSQEASTTEFCPPPGPSAAVPQPRSAGTETTRYLCAAAHLDRAYCEAVLEATVRETHRAVAPCFGVDLSMVARHALLAYRRTLLRDAVLAVLLAVALVVVVSRTASVDPAALGGVQVSDRLLDFARSLLPIGAIVLALAWVSMAVEAWVRFTTLGEYLRRGRRPDAAPMPRGGRTAGLLAELAEAGNVVVYSVYEPFVGSGVQVGSSSYPVALVPRTAEGDATPQPPTAFRATELADALTHSLRTLGLEQLRVDRRLYVGGFDVAGFPELLPDRRRRPVISAPARLLDRLTEHPGGNVRPYLCAEVTGWQGQLVVTSFVRVVVLNGILFIEIATYVLPPLRSEYLAVDAMRIRTRGERLGKTVQSAFAGCLPALLASPIRLLSAVNAQGAARRRDREFNRLLTDKVRIDRGAVSSIREQASADRFDRYFMQLDAVMFASVVQEKVANTVGEFLRARGYQTDKISLIQNNISNTVDNSTRIGNVSGAGNVFGDGNRVQTTGVAAQAARGGSGSGQGNA